MQKKFDFKGKKTCDFFTKFRQKSLKFAVEGVIIIKYNWGYCRKNKERQEFVLDSITQLIKTEIKKQHKSVRQFSEKSGIPYSTLSNALSKGIGGTSYDTVIKICNMLNLKQAYDIDLTVFNEHCYEICTQLAALDERAVHTLKTILKVEYERCIKDKASKEISVARRTLDTCKDFEGDSV